MVLGLAGCGDSGSANGGTQSGKNSGAKYQVGICQLVQHEALDAATKGFKDALKDKLGDEVSFDEQNAAGDASTCSTICTTFVTNDYDLILGNATAALQAASAATDSIPILGTSISKQALLVFLLYAAAPKREQGNFWNHSKCFAFRKFSAPENGS